LPLAVANKNIKFLIGSPKKIINILLIIISFIVSLNIYNAQKKQNLFYKNRLEAEKNKNELIKELMNLENKLSDCKKALKRMDTTEMLSTIGSLGEQTGLRILTVKPQPEEENPFYIKSKVKIIIEAEDYHTIGNFISKLEANPDLYKIESLSITPAKKGGVQLVGPEKKAEEETGLNAEIVIIRFIFKG
jgi:Tfp pilus assembly protein PilO